MSLNYAAVITPFTLSVPDSDLQDFERRLRSTRWPDRETSGGWSQGVPLKTLKNLCGYWTRLYNWRRCEAWFNSFPQFKAKIDGEEIHFLHVRSACRNALPMLLLHGWPGSVLEFHKVIRPLVDPEAHGGTSEDAFHLVIPSLPGYGWSSKPALDGWKVERIGEAMVVLMGSLGYSEWVAQGGDWGADICAVLGSKDPPKSLKGSRINTPFFDTSKEVQSIHHTSEKERKAIVKEQNFEKYESGYFKRQSTRPQTIGYALADSPVAQAAATFERTVAELLAKDVGAKNLSRDEILDNIMVYWLSNSSASSARLYWEDTDNVALPIAIPVGMSVRSGDLVYAPRAWGERYYTNIIHWNYEERGGHFAAWEVPELFVREVRDWFRQLRK